MPFGPRSLPPDADRNEFYACPGCSATFKTKAELRTHIKEEH